MLTRMLTNNTISRQAEQLVLHYLADLEASLPNELMQFSALLTTDLGKAIYSNEGKPDNPSKPAEEVIELLMFRLITQNNLRLTFPNVEILLRIYLCLMVSNCSVERSFLKLKRVKNDVRTTMGKNRLNMLALLSIEYA